MERRFEVSIHAAREGGDLSRHQRGAYRAVSIHAAREGGDRKCATIRPETSFNPRRPRGRRPHVVLPAQAVISFQSTPPARAADVYSHILSDTISGFNPRRPRGRRPRTHIRLTPVLRFNPRRPRGRRRRFANFMATGTGFQSTPPARAATLDI